MGQVAWRVISKFHASILHTVPTFPAVGGPFGSRPVFAQLVPSLLPTTDDMSTSQGTSAAGDCFLIFAIRLH